MNSRRVHAMLVSLPALALALGATVLGGLLAQSIRSDAAVARTVLIGLFAWPMAVAAVSFLARAVRALRDSGRPDPVRTLGIMPVGGAWRIPMRRRHPISTACLIVASAGGLMAALAALDVLATPSLWHVGLSVGGSIILGCIALGVMSAIGRGARAAMVLDPRERVLIVPRVRGRSHVVRIGLDRIRAVTPDAHGPLGLLHRVTVEFDDDMLGQGVTVTLLQGVDPGRAMDLVSWVRGFAASGMAAPRVAPVHAHAPAAAAPAHPPAPAPGHAHAPMPAATAFAAPAMARPRRQSSLANLVGRVNMPAALSGLGLACVLGFVGLGLRMHPQSTSAAGVASATAAATSAADGASTRVATLGTAIDGTAVHVADVASDWIWTVDVSPSSGVSDEQVRALAGLRQRFGNTVRFQVVLVSGERGGELPDARLATRYAGRLGLPTTSVLVRPEPGVAVPRHRMIAPDGRVVLQDSGFMSAGSIERQIGVMSAAARMEDRP